VVDRREAYTEPKALCTRAYLRQATGRRSCDTAALYNRNALPGWRNLTRRLPVPRDNPTHDSEGLAADLSGRSAQGVRNPHDLRHSYATMLLMDHYSPAYVQKQLGHSSISITVDIYGHWIPGEGRKDQDSPGSEGPPRATPDGS
jgi:integrase